MPTSLKQVLDSIFEEGFLEGDAIERPTGVTIESLNNFDEDDSGIFCHLLDESLKDAWDRLLRTG